MSVVFIGKHFFFATFFRKKKGASQIKATHVAVAAAAVVPDLSDLPVASSSSAGRFNFLAAAVKGGGWK